MQLMIVTKRAAARAATLAVAVRAWNSRFPRCAPTTPGFRNDSASILCAIYEPWKRPVTKSVPRYDQATTRKVRVNALVEKS